MAKDVKDNLYMGEYLCSHVKIRFSSSSVGMQYFTITIHGVNVKLSSSDRASLCSAIQTDFYHRVAPLHSPVKMISGALFQGLKVPA